MIHRSDCLVRPNSQTKQSDPFDAGRCCGVPILFLSNGLPPPVATSITPPTGTFQSEELNFKNTRTQQYNVFLEKEFAATCSAPAIWACIRTT